MIDREYIKELEKKRDEMTDFIFAEMQRMHEAELVKVNALIAEVEQRKAEVLSKKGGRSKEMRLLKKRMWELRGERLELELYISGIC